MSKLHVDSVMKYYGNRQILTDVFISCQKGEIIGLLGRNGTGKSTLLQIIFGSLQADDKFVRIGEKITSGLFDNRKKIKYLAQDQFLPSHVKISTLLGLLCNEDKAEQLKEHPFLASRLHKKSKDLSWGEKRVVEILLIIYSDSMYSLLDEPFNGVDPLYKEDIKNWIKEESKQKGFIITDHDYRNVLDIATRIVLIHDGGTKQISSKSELIDWGYIPEIY